MTRTSKATLFQVSNVIPGLDFYNPGGDLLFGYLHPVDRAALVRAITV